MERGITLSDTSYLVREWDLPSPVVLLYGEGHYWVALDYRRCGPDGEPSLLWIDVEAASEQTLAPTFKVFVERLSPSDAYPD